MVNLRRPNPNRTTHTVNPSSSSSRVGRRGRVQLVCAGQTGTWGWTRWWCRRINRPAIHFSAGPSAIVGQFVVDLSRQQL